MISAPVTLADILGQAPDRVFVPGCLVVGDLGLFMLLLTLFIGALVLLSAPGTASTFHYLTMYALFAFISACLVAADNLILFFICWELASLMPWGIARVSAAGGHDTVSIIPFQAAGLLGSVSMLLFVLAVWTRS